jgi:[ribosomal protein S5]-alanine N-acetyltransferase
MILTTNRLILREFVADDWPAVLAYQSDPRYLRYYDWTERSAEDVRTFVQMFLDWQQQQPRHKFQLAVTLKADGRLIGNCGIRLASPGAQSAEIGYELAPDQWGHGYATEAARTIVAFGFGELGLHRITADCIAENLASAHVLEKIGMRREGQLRESEWMKGRWWDALLYGILDREW